MSRGHRGRVLRWLGHRLPGVDAAVRADLVDAVDHVARTAGPRDRTLEAFSLVGCALTTTSRRGTGDDRRQALRQGARVAALVLAVAMAIDAAAAGSVPTAAAGVVLAAALAAGLRAVPAAAAGVLVAAAVGWGGAQPALALLVLVATVVGRPYDGRTCAGGATLAALATAGAAAAAAILPDTATTAVTVLSAAAVFVLLAVGWFDPRYAVAATVLSVGRLVEVDVGAAVRAVAGTGADDVAVLAARLVLMGAGVAVSWLMTRAALDRCVPARPA
jgi:hypothetical protein